MSFKQWLDGKTDKAKVTFNITDVRTGHKVHRGGAGTHDSRPKRERTRSAQKRAAFKDW